MLTFIYNVQPFKRTQLDIIGGLHPFNRRGPAWDETPAKQTSNDSLESQAPNPPVSFWEENIAKFDEFELNRRCARMPNILDLDRVKKFQPLILTKVAFRAIRAKKFRKRTPPKVAILGRFKPLGRFLTYFAMSPISPTEMLTIKIQP